MPKLYEYMGLIIFFYSNEHEPIHVHAQYGNTENKIEIFVKMGKISGIKYKEVPNRKSLNKQNRKHFKRLVTVLADEIVQNWINYFVLHKKIIAKKIDGKL